MASSNLIQQLEQEIARVGGLGRDELVTLWVKAYGHPPPKGTSRKLLIRSAAYYLQAKALGGLKRSVHRQLMQIAAGGKVINKTGNHRKKLKPGVRLVREWHGVTHTVEVIEGGFTWNSEVYRSLSAIAKAITGARWSGPRFFQL